MSGQLGLWDDGPDGPASRAGLQNPRASLYREMRYLLTISKQPGGVGRLSPAGLVHSLGVCLIEDWTMSRGKSKAGNGANTSTLPRFVDVKLTQEEREQFSAWFSPDVEQVSVLQKFADEGYRVGVSWSGEHQTYTVSATCRDPESPNNGMCMTAFSGNLNKAIALLCWKHYHIAGEDWSTRVSPPREDFG